MFWLYLLILTWCIPVGLFGFSPGCCGCCVSLEQDFTGASSTPTGYNETVGTWSYSSDSAHPGASGDILIYDTAWTQTYYRVSASMKTTANNDVLAVVAGYSDSSNYYSAEVTFTSSGATLRIFKTAAGTRTQLVAGSAQALIPTNSWMTVVLCISEDENGDPMFSAWMNPSKDDVALETYVWAVGPVADTALTLPGKAGMYARTATGTVDFDDFAISSTVDSANSCPQCAPLCQSCRHGQLDQMEVQIVGGSFAGSYTLNADAIPGTGPIVCVWRLNNAFSVGCTFPTATYTDLAAYFTSSGTTMAVEVLESGTALGAGVQIGLDSNGGTGYFNWIQYQAASDDFNRADSTNLGGDWSELDGDWQIVSNELFMDEVGVVKWAGTFVPNDDYDVSANVEVNDDDDQAGIVVYCADEDNYYSLEVESDDVSAGDYTLRLIKCVAGSRSTLATDTVTGLGDVGMVAMSLELQQRDNGLYMRGLWNAPNMEVFALEATPLAANPPGFIVHAVTNDVQFDTLSVTVWECDQLSSHDVATFGSLFGCTAPTSINISAP